jgi:hypothetical protein
MRLPIRAIIAAAALGLPVGVPHARGDGQPDASPRPAGSPAQARKLLSQRLLPVPKDGGFSMKGYYVWCPSLIKVGDTYHLFASRWPKASTFPDGYRTQSEIVRAVADRPEGPYRFVEQVIGPREGGFWDGRMAHNPKIVRLGRQYALFYIGSNLNGKTGERAIGFATADEITGPWRRIDKPLPNLVQSKRCPVCDATNPAPCVRPDGTLLLGYRQAPEMLICIASARSLAGPWTVENRDVWRNLPQKPDWNRYEDPDIAYVNGRYEMLVEDNNTERPLAGFGCGIHFYSDDGVHWQLSNPPAAYTVDIAWDDGNKTKVYRRERPQMFVEGGRLTHILTAVKDDRSQDESRIVIQPIAPE